MTSSQAASSVALRGGPLVRHRTLNSKSRPARRGLCAAVTAHKVEITFEGKTHVLEVGEDETILMKALDAGLELPYDCQMGVCMTCPAKLVSASSPRSVALRLLFGLHSQCQPSHCPLSSGRERHPGVLRWLLCPLLSKAGLSCRWMQGVLMAYGSSSREINILPWELFHTHAMGHIRHHVGC